jgi:hypothetical protein
MVPPPLVLHDSSRYENPAVEDASRSQLPTGLRRFQSADVEHRSATPVRWVPAEATPVRFLDRYDFDTLAPCGITPGHTVAST